MHQAGGYWSSGDVRRRYAHPFTILNAQRDEMFKGYLAMIRSGVVKEEDVLTLMSDNTKNEFLKWIESNGNG